MIRRRLTTRAGNGSLQQRLADLETRAGINTEPGEPIALVFVDGNGDCDATRVEVGGRVWNRKKGEHQDDFVQRVMAEIPPDPSGLIPLVLF